MKKNKDGTYTIRASKTIEGKRYQKSFKARTIKEVQSLVDEWKNAPVPSQRVTEENLGYFIDRYIESVDGILSPSTIRLYVTMRKNCYRDIEEKTIEELDNFIIQKWIKKQSQSYSLKYLKNMYSLLTVVCKEQGKTFNVKLPKETKEERYLPDLNDIQEILKVTEGTRIEGQIKFAIYLGLRQSEIYALQWEDITGNQIYIHNAKVMNKEHKYEKKRTKTRAGTRTLTIPDPLMEWIEPRKKEQGNIFETTPCHVNRIWKKIKEKNSLPNIRIHDLRKANASILLLLNLPDKYIMQRLGWSDYSTMKNIYQYVFQSEQRKLDVQVNDFFSQLTVN